MPINCIAIDDDVSSLENLNAYIEKLPRLQMMKVFTNPLQALSDISTTDNIDIIFMDIEMPELSGVELAGKLREKTKHLIFTTAHAKYAIDAFKVDADAYLLKPYSLVHFSNAVQNLFPNEPIKPVIPQENFFYIPVKNKQEQTVKIEYNDLVALEKVDDMIYFRTIKDNYVSLKFNFSKMLTLLRSNPTFIQVSSSAIISKLHIKSVLDKQIVLSGGLSVILTGKYEDSFLNFIHQNIHNKTLVS